MSQRRGCERRGAGLVLLHASRLSERSPAYGAEGTIRAAWDGRPEAILPARVPGRGWARQFYNLRAGSPRGAAFSCLWKEAGLRAGQRHASVLGTVPLRKVGRPRRARRVRPRGRTQCLRVRVLEQFRVLVLPLICCVTSERLLFNLCDFQLVYLSKAGYNTSLIGLLV